ncbi:MAG: lipoprotein [Gammaproteobacteria bacterium]
MTASASGLSKRKPVTLLCAVLLASLSACGQIGPLYLPENAPPASEPADTEPSAKENDPEDKSNRL